MYSTTPASKTPVIDYEFSSPGGVCTTGMSDNNENIDCLVFNRQLVLLVRMSTPMYPTL